MTCCQRGHRSRALFGRPTPVKRLGAVLDDVSPTATYTRLVLKVFYRLLKG